MEVSELRALVKIDLGQSEAVLAGVERRLQETTKKAEGTVTAADKLTDRAAALGSALGQAGRGLEMVKAGMESAGVATAKNVLEVSRLETRLSLINSRLDENQARFSKGEINARDYSATLIRLGKEATQVTNDLRNLNAQAADAQAVGEAKKAAEDRAKAAKAMGDAYKAAAKEKTEAEKAAANASKQSAKEQADALASAATASEQFEEMAVGAAETVASSFGLSLDPIQLATDLVIGMTAAFVGLNVAVTALAVKFGGEFNSTLAMLGAQTNATAQEMEAIRRKALELGADKSLPQFANDAAQAMLELSKGGMSVQQAMDAGRGTLMLAAAAQIDAAEAAEYQSDALNTFNLRAAEAVRVADLLAATSNAASGEITDFGQGLQQAGAVAAQANVSIEDTLTLLALLAKNGIKGSDAGTSLKTMLMALRAPSDEAAKALKKIGVEVFDSEGKMKSARQIIIDLTAAIEDLDEKSQANVLAKIFGTDAIRAAAIITKEGAAGFDEMKAKVTETGVAAKLAAAQMTGVGGAMTVLQKQGVNAAISLYDSFSGSLERILRSFGTTFDKLGEYLGENSEAGRELRAIISAIGVDMEKFAAGAIDLFDLDNPEQVRKDLQDIINLVRFALDIAGGVVMIVGYIKQGYNAFRGWVDSAGTFGKIIEGYVNPIRRWTSLWSESLGYAKETTMEMERQRQIALIAEAEKLRKQQINANLLQAIAASGFDKKMEELAEKQGKKKSLDLDTPKTKKSPDQELLENLSRELERAREKYIDLTTQTQAQAVAAKLAGQEFAGMTSLRRQEILVLAEQIDAQNKLNATYTAQKKATESATQYLQRLREERKKVVEGEPSNRQKANTFLNSNEVAGLVTPEQRKQIVEAADELDRAEAITKWRQSYREMSAEIARDIADLQRQAGDFQKPFKTFADQVQAENEKILGEARANLVKGAEADINALIAMLEQRLKAAKELDGLIAKSKAFENFQNQTDLTDRGFGTDRLRVQNDIDLGITSRNEGQRELNNLVRQQRQFLLQAAEAALKLAETEKDPARRQAIIDQVEAYRQQASQLRTLGEQAAMEFRNSFQEYTKDLFKNLLTGNWREGIAGFFQSIADDLLDRASSMFSDLVTNLLWGEDGQSGLLGGLLKTFTDFISKIFSNWFGGFFADGGDFEGGKPIVVGERGPEVIVPSRAGTVVSNEDVRRAVGEGGGARVVNFYNQQMIDGRRPLSRESRRQVESGIQQGLEKAARAD